MGHAKDMTLAELDELIGDVAEAKGLKITRAIVAHINEHHALLNLEGKQVVMQEIIRPATGHADVLFSTVEDMRVKFANKPCIFDDRGKPIGWHRIWLESEHRRSYEGLAFEPGGEPTVHGNYNVWRGWPVPPVAGDCSKFVEHVMVCLCGNDEDLFAYVMDWMADAVQNPTRRPGVAIVLQGARGTGKGVFARYFGALFGPHYMEITSSAHLTGKFNEHMKALQLVFVDEGFWAGNKDGEGRLKAEITEDFVTIEPKGRPVLRLPNHRRFIIASNEDFVVPAGPTERRFAVLEVNGKHQQQPLWFDAIFQEMDHGGVPALMHDLSHRDITKSNLRNIPKTAGLMAQKEQHLTPEANWMLELLEEGKHVRHSAGGERDAWSLSFTADALHDDYLWHCESLGVRYPQSKIGLSRAIRKMVGPLQRDKHKSPPSLRMPDLDEARLIFDAYIGQGRDWGCSWGGTGDR